MFRNKLRYMRTHMYIPIIALLTPLAIAQNPFAGNAKAAKAGEYEFRINCALCHGLGAHGGGRGPDLTRAQKKHTHSDARNMFQVISNSISGTAMPANGTNGQGVGMTDEEIWQIITYIRSQEVKAAPNAAGNAAHGKQLFYGDANAPSATWSKAREDVSALNSRRSVARAHARPSSSPFAIRAAASPGD